MRRYDEGNKDYKNLDSKAFGLFNHGHIQNIKVALVKIEI